MANIDTLKGKLTAIANAIRQKTGRSALLGLDEMPTEILSIDGGGGGDVPNPDDPLLLVDWDGTLLYSYTYEDAQLISEFPDPPTHEGLTFQSWNWTEVIAKTWLQNHRGEQLKVGATYTPTDGQDHNYWRSPRLDATNKIYLQHRARTVLEQNEFYNNRALDTVTLPNGIAYTSNNSFQNCQALTHIILPRSTTTIDNSTFNYCTILRSIILPYNLEFIGSKTFKDCASLSEIAFPDKMTLMGSSAFEDCPLLQNIVLPRNLSSISNYAFRYCYNLLKMDIPTSVTSIGTDAFSSCSSLVDVIIRGTPTLGSSTVFSSNPSNQRFYVHRSDLSWFETTTNWSAIYGEGKIVAAADYIEYLHSIGVDTSDFEGE